MASYKILHLIGGGEIGGAEQHVLELLTQLDRQAFSPTLGCLTAGPLTELACHYYIPTETFLMKHPLDLRPILPLLAWARREQLSLIHAHGTRGNLIGRLAARRLAIPCISTVHSALANDYLSPAATRLAITLDRLTLPLSSGIIAVSDYIAEDVRQRGGRNIRTIYNGRSPLCFPDPVLQRHQFRAAWNIPQESVVLGCIARLHPTKGHTYLLEAVERLQAQLPDVHLLLVGDGPLFSELKETLQQKGIPATMTGYLPQAYQALPAMDIFVLPSINEGMGLVLLEAMQAHIPIVATKVGGIPEVVRAGQDALLVPPADAGALAEACLKIRQNPDLATALIASAATRWEKFSLSAMLSQTEDFYLQVIQGFS